MAGQPGDTILEVPVARVRVSLAPFGVEEVENSLTAFEATGTAGSATFQPTLPPADVLLQIDVALAAAGQRRRTVCDALLRAPRLTWGSDAPMLRCWQDAFRSALLDAKNADRLPALATEIVDMILALATPNDVLALLPCVFGVGRP